LRVALTFDTEHPGRPTRPGVEDEILSVLGDAGLRATFFLQGRWACAFPDRARRIAAAGHLVGNHSHHHAPMDALTAKGFRADVRAAEETIRTVTGVDPKPWFRCPFGSGADKARVLGLLAELGYRHVGWDVDPADWNETRTAEKVAAIVLDGVRAQEDSVVLLHGWPAVTAEALPAIVEGLLAAGADVVDVQALPDQETVARKLEERRSSSPTPAHE
jgi:peptidoglycan-N-acetylglucosamine deacetylase